MSSRDITNSPGPFLGEWKDILSYDLTKSQTLETGFKISLEQDCSFV